MSSETLLKQLQQAVKGLLYTSESDAPLQAFAWPKAEVGADTLTPELIQKIKKIPAGQKVAMDKFPDFFAPMTQAQSWYGAEEKATMQGFQALVKILQSSLTDLHVYKYGSSKQDVYVVGKTPDGDFAGVHTQVTET